MIIVNGEVVAKGENIEEMLDRVRQEYPPVAEVILEKDGFAVEIILKEVTLVLNGKRLEWTYLINFGWFLMRETGGLILRNDGGTAYNRAYLASCLRQSVRIVVGDRNLNDLDKILYYLCLPRIIDKSAREPLLQEATGISKENKIRLFEQLLENNTFLMLFQILQGKVEREEMRAYLSTHFLGTLFEQLRGLPEKIRAQVTYNLMHTTDYDLNCVMRPASKWYIFQSATEEELEQGFVREMLEQW